MGTTSWRNGAFAVVVLIACGGWSQAQSFGTWPHSPAEPLQGVWYNSGDLTQPCYINLAPGGRMAVLTDERGGKVRGRVVGPGQIAVGVGEGLLGQVDGSVLYWSNGSYWTR